jgi:hypothetical protein
MIAMDSKSGKEVAHLPTPDGMDGVYFDRVRRRVYVSGGRDMPAGFVYIYQQKDADHYESVGKIPVKTATALKRQVREKSQSVDTVAFSPDPERAPANRETCRDCPTSKVRIRRVSTSCSRKETR